MQENGQARSTKPDSGRNQNPMCVGARGESKRRSRGRRQRSESRQRRAKNTKGKGNWYPSGRPPSLVGYPSGRLPGILSKQTTKHETTIQGHRRHANTTENITGGPPVTIYYNYKGRWGRSEGPDAQWKGNTRFI